jgi:hypothetical protein
MFYAGINKKELLKRFVKSPLTGFKTLLGVASVKTKGKIRKILQSFNQGSDNIFGGVHKANSGRQRINIRVYIQ